METKRYENIPGLPEGEWAEIGKFSYGQSSRIKAKSVSIKMRAGDQAAEGEVDLLEAQFLMVLYGIKAASFFPIEWDEARRLKFIEEELSAEAGDFLFNEINLFNGPKPEALKK